MPVVFAQPEQDYTQSRVSGGGGGGGNSVASAMADIAAQRAQYADRFANAEMQQQANIVGAQIQAHAAAQERAAQLEMQNWVMRQRFTQQDQQELARAYNSVSEIQMKIDSGEYTPNEGFQLQKQVSDRINLLQFKEQHTRNQALADERKARADLIAEQKEHAELMNRWSRGELASQTETLILPQHQQFMSQYMQRHYPELKVGSDEYNGMMQMEASEMGRAITGIRTKSGFVPLSKLMGGGTASAGAASGADGGAPGPGKPMTERDVATIGTRAMEAADKHFEKLGKEPTEDEWKAEVKKRMSALEEITGERAAGGGKAAKAKTQYEETSNANKVRIQEIQDNPNLSEPEKKGVSGILRKWQELSDEYADNPRPIIAKRMNELMTQYQNFKDAIALREQIKAKKTPAQAAQPAASPEPQGQQWGQSLAQDVGNIGRGVGGEIRQTAQDVANTSIRKDILFGPGSPLPDSWERYLFGD